MSKKSKISNNFLPYGRQWIDDEDIDAVVEVLRSDYLTTGPKVGEFEQSLKDVLGVRHVIACSSGTAALHLSLVALDVAAGDKVIVPSISFVATANAVRMCGAEVVFADVNENTGLMDVKHLDEAIKRAGGKVKAVIPVHLTGQCSDMAAIKSLADAHNIKIIADACHSLGAKYKGALGTSMVGNCNYEEISCFSFHPVKTIAMGEGGAIATNDDDYAKTLRSCVSHGAWQGGENVVNEGMAFDCDGNINPWYHEFHRLGWNYRASDIHCALGVSQMKKLTDFVEKRTILAQRYTEDLAELSPKIIPIQQGGYCSSAWHLFSVLMDFDAMAMDKAQFMRSLKEHGIGTQVHYIPIHLQPFYRGENPDLDLPGAVSYYEKTLSLPLYPHMELADVDYVVTNLKSLL